MEIGLSVETFWSLTPRETALAFEAYASRIERERKHDLAIAWHGAALARQKRLTPLKKLLGGGKPKVLTEAEKTRKKLDFEQMSKELASGLVGGHDGRRDDARNRRRSDQGRPRPAR